MMRCPRTSSLLMGGLLIGLLAPAGAGAQTSKSSAVAKELSAVLDQGKVSAIAARMPGGDDRFAAALYFRGSQLLVIAARYDPAEILNNRLAKKEYREIYIDLNTASIPDSRRSIEDFGADGLLPRKSGALFDTYQQGGAKTVAFDGDWARQQLTEEAYQKAFAGADEDYEQILAALLAEAKKGS
jgi:hypothetical protein